MRPPICEACEAEVDPAGGLVRCAPTPESIAWRERAERDGIVGHPRDEGWFCEAHAAHARELAAGHSLSEVIRAVRARDRRAREDLGRAPVRDGAGAASSRDLPGARSMRALHRGLRKLLPALADAAGLDPASIARTTTRDWSPMDGAVPPNCPFSDATADEAEAGGVRLALRFEAAHWSEDDCARTYLTLSLSGAGERDYRVAAASPAAGAPYAVEFLRATGAVPAEVRDLLGGA